MRGGRKKTEKKLEMEKGKEAGRRKSNIPGTPSTAKRKGENGKGKEDLRQGKQKTRG